MRATNTYVHKSPRVCEIEVANGERVLSLGKVRARLCLEGYYGTIEAEVLPTATPGMDVILGDDWLRAHRAKLDYTMRVCTVQ